MRAEGHAGSEEAGASLRFQHIAARESMELPDSETPRFGEGSLASPIANGAPWGSPTSPDSVRKTKSRAGRLGHRHDSLHESKVLLVTDIRRTESIAQPDLFTYNSHFEKLAVVGKTKTSEVFKVRHRQSGEIFAVKRSRRRFRTKLQRERCLREIKAVAALPPHPNIVGQHRAWQEGGHFYLQMDFCSHGSLHDRLCIAGPLPDQELWEVAVDVAHGLSFLHRNDTLHLDIKPENIYRSMDVDTGMLGPWRIGDFGLAVGREAQEWEEGDGDYVGPELLRAGGELSPAADVFSLGATLFECATGRKLPRKEGSADAADFALPDRPTAFLKLLQAMLHPCPDTRPSAAQVAAFAAAARQGADVNKLTAELLSPCEERQDEAALEDPDTVPSPMSIAADSPQPERIVEEGISNSGNKQMRWVPSLSPLISEGTATPGAAAGLMGLTPPTAGMTAAAGTFVTNTRLETAPEVHTATNGDVLSEQSGRNVPSLRLPLLNSSAVCQHQQMPSTTARTSDTSGGFRIRRRDVLSPEKETMASADDSEAVSFSCDTTGSASELDFPDVLSPGASRGPLSATVGTFRRLSSFSMGKDLHTSPEFGAPSAPGGATPGARGRRVSRSVDSSPQSAAALVFNEQHEAVPAFPAVQKTMSDHSRLPSAEETRDPTAHSAIRAASHIRLRAPNVKLSPHPSPFDICIPGHAKGDRCDTSTGAVAEEFLPPATVVPPLILPIDSSQGVRRKRQHSSRRALVHALREGGDLTSARSMDACSARTDLCSSRSIEHLMPAKKGARHGGAFELNEGTKDDLDIGPSIGTSPLTQRSSRSQPNSARTAEREGKTARCMAVAAAIRMNCMTLDDG